MGDIEDDAGILIVVLINYDISRVREVSLHSFTFSTKSLSSLFSPLSPELAAIIEFDSFSHGFFLEYLFVAPAEWNTIMGGFSSLALPIIISVLSYHQLINK